MSSTFRLKAIADMNDSRFQAGLDRMLNKTGMFKSSLATIARSIGIAFGVRQIYEFGKAAVENAAILNDLAKQTGTTVEVMSALEHSAMGAGLGIQDIATALIQMQRILGHADASEGLKKQFEALGLSAEQLKGKSVAEQFELISKGILTATNQADAMEAAFSLLGRGAGRFMEIIREVGEKGLPEMQAQLREAGDLMTTETAASLSELTTWYTRLGRSIKNVGAEAVDLLPKLGRTLAVGAELAGGASKEGTGFIPFEDLTVSKATREAARRAEFEKEVAAGLKDQEDLLRFQLETEKNITEEAKKRAEAQRIFEVDMINASAEAADAIEKARMGGGRLDVTAANAPGQVGMFIGGKTDPMMGIAQQQLNIQREIKKINERQVAVLEEKLGNYAGAIVP